MNLNEAPSTVPARRRRLIALLGVNAAIFVAAWGLTEGWYYFLRYRPFDGLPIAVAVGVSFGQFLVLALYLALHARPSPRRWLMAMAFLASASLAHCTLSLLFELQWLARRWINPTFALFNQLAFLLSLIAVGLLLLIAMRLLMWPVRRFLGWRVEWEDEPATTSETQFSLAEIFFITAGAALGCMLGRALFDAMLTGPLILGAILLAGALPIMAATFFISPGRGRWRDWSAVLVWSCVIALGLTPLVALAHNSMGLLDEWIGRWTTLELWSPLALASAGSFTLAVALCGRLNWLALARLGLRCRADHRAAVIAPPVESVDATARLTPPAAPR